MTREQFKWGAFAAIIFALTYVPTEWCQYIGGGKRCVASKWRFLFDVAGVNQVDVDRLIIQVIVVVVAIAGLWILVFKDKLPSGRSVSEAADAPPLQSAVGKPLQAQSAHTVESGAQTTIGGLHEAKVFKPRKLRQPVGRRMLGGALLLGGISIPVLIGLALFASMQIELLGYVVFAAFAAAVGAFLGLIGWEL